MKLLAEGTDDGGFIEDLIPDVAAALSAGELGSREDVEAEIDIMLRTMREFWSMEPDQVLLCVSALGARASEMSVHLHRMERKVGRTWAQIRTMQVERIREELKLQFSVHSRLIEVRRQDIELNR